ncbi:MAG: response regulator, partial [Alphaproteobacteria bacterium]|nr:response regulator [Alphaproteobacteria bacterium]
KVFGVGDIMTCESAKEAIDLLTITQARTRSRYINRVDIVITDWLMPNGSGEDLIKWIRNHERDSVRFLPIIVTSGYTTEYVTNKCRDLGVNETLVKPISGTSLASRICSVIANPRPFIQSPDYFGPDRRRKEMVFAGIEKRTQKPKIVEVDPV